MKLTNLSKYQDEYEKCTFCGNCRVVCPSFLVEKKESTSCRGRVNLMGGLLDKESEVKLSNKVSYDLTMCLNCLSCTEVCPAGVDYSRLILSAKADLYDSRKVPLVKKIVFRNLLPNNKLLRFWLQVFRFFQKFFIKTTLDNNKEEALIEEIKLLDNTDNKNNNKGKQRYASFLKRSKRRNKSQGIKNKGQIEKLIFKTIKIDEERILPEVPKYDFFRLPIKRTKLKGSHKKRVALFLGCSAKNIYPLAADHLVNLLRKAKIEVLIPQEQVCCGTPVFNNGDLDSAKKLAIQNLSIFNKLHDVEAIITMCGSCGHTLKNEYNSFLDIGSFKYPIYDIVEYIVKEEIPVFAKLKNTTVTYHHSCHLNKGMKVNSVVTDLLKDIYSYNYIESKDADKCCGGGGTFNLTYYDIAKKITTKKIKNIKDSEAEIVATGCPNCMMRIDEQRAVEKVSGLEIKHTIELLNL